MKRKQNRGVTLVEVLVALVIALVIAIGVMSYQYAGAQHARKTDVRVTASRIGLLFLENWIAMGGFADEDIYDPVYRLDLGKPPLEYYADFGGQVLPGATPPNGLPFKLYRIFTNGSYFWVEMAYNDQLYPMRELSVRVAWGLDFQSEDLDYDPQRLMHFSKYVVYVPPS